jgi:hypothetical protein
MQSPQHRVGERGPRRLALRFFCVKLCRARVIQLYACGMLEVINCVSIRRLQGVRAPVQEIKDLRRVRQRHR